MYTLNASTLFFLTELRRRLITSVLIFIIIFLTLIYFANDLYALLASPLLKQLPQGQKLLATNLLSGFFAPVDLVFYLSIFLAIPFFFYQLWSFVAPALYKNEKKIIWPFLLLSILFFYSGI